VCDTVNDDGWRQFGPVEEQPILWAFDTTGIYQIVRQMVLERSSWMMGSIGNGGLESDDVNI
jgi:hypothetical protein